MQLKKTTNGFLAVNDNAPAEIEPSWFTHDFWQQQQAITGFSLGRYVTWFIEKNSQQWVLRHYYRGGLIGKLIHDHYCYLGIKNTRAVKEFELLEQLYEEGFAVPKPIAAYVKKSVATYQADIIIEKIPNACDLVAYLTKHPLQPEEWQALGKLVATFHQRGVYHADLNAKNILIATEPLATTKKFYLIDFDRGELRKANQRWQQQNLDRLHRSFVKEKKKAPELAFEADNWTSLQQGYNGAI